jgi:hypothetical protein
MQKRWGDFRLFLLYVFRRLRLFSLSEIFRFEIFNGSYYLRESRGKYHFVH